MCRSFGSTAGDRGLAFRGPGTQTSSLTRCVHGPHGYTLLLLWGNVHSPVERSFRCGRRPLCETFHPGRSDLWGT